MTYLWAVDMLPTMVQPAAAICLSVYFLLSSIKGDNLGLDMMDPVQDILSQLNGLNKIDLARDILRQLKEGQVGENKIAVGTVVPFVLVSVFSVLCSLCRYFCPPVSG